MFQNGTWKGWTIILGFSLIFFLSMLLPHSVYADDSLPPDLPAETLEAEPVITDQLPETAQPDEGEIVQSPAGEDESGQTDTEENPAEDPEPIDGEDAADGQDGETEEAVSPEITEDALSDDAQGDTETDDVEIVIKNEDGETLNMASQEGQEVISSADPWWMVGTQKFAVVKTGGSCPDDSLCMFADDPITYALNYIDTYNLVPTDGILHVEADTYNEDVTIDGSSGNGNLAKLKGLVSDGTSGNTFINGNITISNTVLGFTLSGFTIDGYYVSLSNNVGILNLSDLNVSSPTSSGITVAIHNGAVNVDRVKSNNNANYGLNLDNRNGSGGVTVTNSEFSHNGSGIVGSYWAGVNINSNGLVTFNGVSASDNYGNGARISSAKGITIKNSVFSDNESAIGALSYGNGLYFNETTPNNHILLENVRADNNDIYGIYLINAGTVTLKNVSADANGLINDYDGIYIKNIAGTGTVTIYNSTSSNNGGSGFEVESYRNVNINGITALDNGLLGVNIDNCDYDSATGGCLGNGSVTISGNLPNISNNNGSSSNGIGFKILSSGNITLSSFQADGNYDGVYLVNGYTGRSGIVTLNVTYVPPAGEWVNSASGNDHYGIYIHSYGNIMVDKCVAEHNGYVGANINNDTGPAIKTITIKNSSFSFNAITGLIVSSKGNITIQDVDAHDNISARGISTNVGVGSGGYRIIGTKGNICDFSGNGETGIYINWSGTVTLSNIAATGNRLGASINNSYGEGKFVTITDADFSGSTNGSGLTINSKGAVTLTNVTSNDNTNGLGVDINNSGASKAQVVKITNGVFNSNASSYGLTLYSLGSVTLNSVQANLNGASGVLIDTCIYDGSIPGCKGSGNISIIGSDNKFNNNVNSGLYLILRGSVNLLNIVADNNGLNGLTVDNDYENSIGNVTLNASAGKTNSFSGNNSEGVYIQTHGNITLQHFMANNNNATSGTSGVWLDNSSGPANKKVVLAYAEINDNQLDGLYIKCTGPVTLTSVQVLRSSKHYWEIRDDTGDQIKDRLPYEAEYDEIWYFVGEVSQSIELLLSSDYFDPYLELFDANWVLLTADDNSGTGTVAQITYTLPTDGMYYVRVSSVVADEYGKYLLNMTGASQENGNYSSYMGVYIDNTFNNGTGNVTVTAPKGGYGLDVRDNNYSGVYITTKGNIAISGSTINYNGYRGANLSNENVDGKTVTLKDTSFDFNDYAGVSIQTKGVVNWINGGANYSRSGNGAIISNYGAGAYRPVSLSGLTFNGNATYGFNVQSIGAITLKNVGASNNLNDNGATLDNCMYSSGCTGVGNVTLSGTLGLSDFSGNKYSGLSVNSAGNISITNVNASDNELNSGLALYNNFLNGYGNILVKNSVKDAYNNISGNGNYGAEVYSLGTITLSNIMVKENGETGLYVNNTNSASAKNVTLSRIISADNEGNAGIDVYSKGVITLSYMEDRGNDSNGIRLSNTSAATPQAVIVTRTSIIGNASGYGLYIQSMGDVTLNNVSAQTSMYGAYIDNSSSPSAKVTVLGTLGQNTFSGNDVDGLTVLSNGNVNLTSIVADQNGRKGIFADAGGALTVTNLWTAKNGYQGLDLLAGLDATISNVQCFSNGATANEDGMMVRMGTEDGVVKILNSAFVGNYGSGIAVNGTFNVDLINTFYFGNDADNSGDLNFFNIP
ncbi:right-handed parallel beta-helix repeat-containing protein [Pelolinea submarina]|nr:right-handed parallel beta-helix repeat-containing protein [Pelolinea submarina]BBB49401.1 hypothetical protein Pelsub_P2632 [Pelolinea submarina]